MEGKYPLDHDAGRRDLFFGDSSSKCLCQRAIYLEKMFFGIGFDYNCRAVYWNCSKPMDALACLGL